jgi:hypothetical protein
VGRSGGRLGIVLGWMLSLGAAQMTLRSELCAHVCGVPGCLESRDGSVHPTQGCVYLLIGRVYTVLVRIALDLIELVQMCMPNGLGAAVCGSSGQLTLY